jgi:hypothetical protein
MCGILRNNSPFIYMIYDIYTKFDTLLYFKALMEREKERRAFIVTYMGGFCFPIYEILYNT